eukprot:gnl/MRDRNA2_/MRDRNA2_88714_c0_seq1.p1 gnl/MRDRNA2_/MRDRNA2_88714_c0~~gnl/MRDRNA2_/MRDRNA2_88714_c0_seq1.p1  ORF type:complete len:239 (+),score=40.91 gnl/MRDRNA2_/MRDRNA2_88714_c0_seq1:128-844(+)
MCRSKSMVFPTDPNQQMSRMQSRSFSGSLQFENCNLNQGCPGPAAFTPFRDPGKLKFLDQWTSDDIASWLCVIGLVNCAAQVRSHDIAGDVVGDVTFEDAKEMGLREIDAYRLIRALGELQVLVKEVWRRPNQLSDRLKIDSLQHHHAKLMEKKMKSDMPQESKRIEHDSGQEHAAEKKPEQRFEQVSCSTLKKAHIHTEVDSQERKVAMAPRSPQTPPQLPIKKRVRFNDQVQRISI